MAEQEQQQATVEDKPGTGIDRTVIRDLLVLTPAERLELIVASARNLADFLAVKEEREKLGL